jgi:hypothetical protein
VVTSLRDYQEIVNDLPMRAYRSPTEESREKPNQAIAQALACACLRHAAAMAPLATIALGDLPASEIPCPIFAVIAEHKAAVEACIALDDEAESKVPLDYEGAVFRILFTTAPTTVAGVAGWLQHLASPEHPGGHGIVATTGQHYDAEFQGVVTRQLPAVATVLMATQS